MRQDKDKEMHEIFTRVKENQERLRSCPRHSFDIDITPGKQLSKRWVCIHCKGEVDTLHKAYYEDGLRHACTNVHENDYDFIRKIILKNLIVHPSVSGFMVSREVVEQLREYFIGGNKNG